MAYADSIRVAAWTINDVATLIEGIGASGYPLTFADWTPTVGAGGSMTLSSVVISKARFARIGKLAVIHWYIRFTTVAPASNYVSITVPTSCQMGGGGQGTYWLRNTTDGPSYFYGASASTLYLFGRTGGNFDIVSGNIVSGFCVYETT